MILIKIYILPFKSLVFTFQTAYICVSIPKTYNGITPIYRLQLSYDDCEPLFLYNKQTTYHHESIDFHPFGQFTVEQLLAQRGDCEPYVTH
jgi:hypothetical protein